ncbi:hypothetical protein C7I36_00885 [Zobellella taiwanensis]|uniref:Pilus assembly protein FimV n=1 Tax=Zobellella taiwanensis TaxID=347535 RepID=A0A2P7RDY0_9GAMM|nr:FimV/HubP family polar landmark protein [Zobellella taiwanensis]PSJ48409.1 hypothetical protein C7I36_00885 [Zobellella taiwanensis]
MKRLRPHCYSALALWLACTLPAQAQEEFYIELRGPESSAPAAAPAAAPRPAASAPANLAPGRYGPVTRTDTLWSIAARHTPAPATVQQTMVALYYLNPGAFVRGNINYLQRGASLRLPTLTQAQQRSPREAEAEFRRLSRQGSAARTAPAERPAPARAVASAPAKPEPAAPKVETPKVVAPVEPPAAAPVVATPPQASAAEPATVRVVPVSEPSVPRAAPVPEPEPLAPETPSPAQAEELALARLQARLLDELKTQVAMSNEQLAELSNNNQALRTRLGELTEEVNQLKSERQQESAGETGAPGNGLDALLANPLNLALMLVMPALLLLALFTLWWRARVRRELAEQEQDLANRETLLDDERSEFDELFTTDLSPDPDRSESPDLYPAEPDLPEPAVEKAAEGEIDEDAFARFLAEQQEAEDAQAQRRDEVEGAPLEAEEEREEIDYANMMFDDESSAGLATENTVSNDDIDALLFDGAVDAEPERRAEADAEPEPVAVEPPAEPAPSRPADAPGRAAEEDPFAFIDSLMEESEQPGPQDARADEYDKVLGQGRDVDIDFDEGGMGAKLDLARAYIEIDDIDSARELLNEALAKGNDEHQAEARKLLQRLARR